MCREGIESFTDVVWELGQASEPLCPHKANAILSGALGNQSREPVRALAAW